MNQMGAEQMKYEEFGGFSAPKMFSVLKGLK